MIKHLDLRSLNSISDITSGASVSSTDYLKHSSDSAVPFIRTGDMQEGTIDQSNLISVEKEKTQASKAVVGPGDVLFSTKGTIGKIAIVPKSITKGIAASQITIIKPNRRIIDPEYLGMILSSSFVKKQFEPLVTGAVIRFLSINGLRSLKVPVPRLSEQKKIVKKIKDLHRKETQLDEKKTAIQRKITEIIGSLFS